MRSDSASPTSLESLAGFASMPEALQESIFSAYLAWSKQAPEAHGLEAPEDAKASWLEDLKQSVGSGRPWLVMDEAHAKVFRVLSVSGDNLKGLTLSPLEPGWRWFSAEICVRGLTLAEPLAASPREALEQLAKFGGHAGDLIQKIFTEADLAPARETLAPIDIAVGGSVTLGFKDAGKLWRVDVQVKPREGLGFQEAISGRVYFRVQGASNLLYTVSGYNRRADEDPMWDWTLEPGATEITWHIDPTKLQHFIRVAHQYKLELVMSPDRDPWCVLFEGGCTAWIERDVPEQIPDFPLSPFGA